ncbi:MAG: DUF4956 domain-containing protein [Chitinivibrionales bacterium]|nr:DUF4956 domain-containing protein [Chitinivibrionales bacterium]
MAGGFMLDSLFDINRGGGLFPRVPAGDIVLRMLVSIGFGLLLSLLHGMVHRRMGTKSKFQWALAVLPLISATVILVIGNNLVRAFGLIGAVALVRFRTVVKNSLDMSFIFLAIALGIAAGTHLFMMGTAAFALFGILLISMDILGYGIRDKRHHKYTVSIKTDDIHAADGWLHMRLGDLVMNSEFKTIRKSKNYDLVYRMVFKKGVTYRDVMTRIDTIAEGNIKNITVRRL